MLSFIYRKLLHKGGEWGKGGGSWELMARAGGGKQVRPDLETTEPPS